MKKILTTAILAGSTVASFAAITVSHKDGVYDKTAGTGTISMTGIEVGDVVVLMASTNKKGTVSAMEFSSTSLDAFTDHDVASETGNVTNPNQWASYTSITTAGDFDFTLTDTLDGKATLKWVAYVLHSDAGKTIELLDVAATDIFDLAPAAADPRASYNYSNVYSWTGSRDATILEANSGIRGDIALDGQLSTDNGGGGRIIASGTTTGTGFTTDFTFEVDNNTTITRTGSAGVLGLAFSEVVPEPSSTALLGLGGLALMLRRRR